MKKVVVYVTESEARSVREAIAGFGQSRIGNYTESTFRGGTGSARTMSEERIEFACDDATFAQVLAAIDTAAPLYGPTVDSWNLEMLEL